MYVLVLNLVFIERKKVRTLSILNMKEERNSQGRILNWKIILYINRKVGFNILKYFLGLSFLNRLAVAAHLTFFGELYLLNKELGEPVSHLLSLIMAVPHGGAPHAPVHPLKLDYWRFSLPFFLYNQPRSSAEQFLTNQNYGKG